MTNRECAPRSASRQLHARQSQSRFDVTFLTISNCLVNMIAPAQYAELLLSFDRRIAEAFGQFGIHNCAWTADPYLDHYATVPYVGYIDMGIASDLRRARDLFPDARRAIMYTPMDLANKAVDEIRDDFRRIALEYGPCDIVIADIEAGTPDDRITTAMEMCHRLSCNLKGP